MNFSPSLVKFKAQWCYCRKVKENGKKNQYPLAMFHWHEHCACYLEVLSWRKTTLGLIAQHPCVPLLSGSDEKLLSGEPLLLPHLMMHPCGVYQNLLTSVWIQGVWRGMPRVLRQFCWSTRYSSGWGPVALEAAEYHLRGAGNGGTRINQVEVNELSLQSTFSSSHCPLSTQRMLWENLRLFVRLSFTCHCHWCCWSFNSHCFPFFWSQEHFPSLPLFLVPLIWSHLIFPAPLRQPK